MNPAKLLRGTAAAVLAVAVGAPALVALAADPTRVEAPQTMESEARTSQDEALAKRREKLVSEAVDALKATGEAIEALETKDIERANARLESATGKIDLLLSRYPEASLLPVDVDVSEVDVVMADEEIGAVLDRAKRAIDDGQVQVARRLLGPLASELVFTTTQLPLASYPSAIRLAAPLIDEGAIDEAVAALRAALATLVVQKDVVPLPVLRAELLLAAAEEQMESPPEIESAEARADDEAETEPLSPEQLLAQAREQLDRAALLGYGQARSTYPKLVERLAKLEKTLQPEPTSDWSARFASLRKSLSELGSSLLQ